jgi:hypothetical protein
MALQFTTSYLDDSLTLFRYYKKLGDGALRQVSDEGLNATIGADMNSIAVIVRHLAGNMKSRWTDFLTSDGEKPFRDRDAEFEDPQLDRKALLDMWEEGWACVFTALEPMTEASMHQTITIRGEKHSVMQAINRQMGHYAYHIGQIVLLAKYLAGDQWSTLSIPRGDSKQFAQRVARGEASQR